jgi:endonuclease-3
VEAAPQIRTSIAANRERAPLVYDRLAELYPDIRCTLDYHSPFQLLIMTALAAQCTDARVNIVCNDLFPRYPTPQAFLEADVKDVEKMIHSCGFYRQKARNIMATCKSLVEQFGGEVPRTMEELVQLAGVGRKTANVVLGECFGHQGVIVDTHCTRLTNRLGFTKNQDAVKIEQDLMKVWPPDRWTLFSHFMVFHGRAVCTARAPKCSQCTLRDLCPFPESREGKKIAK